MKKRNKNFVCEIKLCKNEGMGKCERCRRYYASVAYDISKGIPTILALCDGCRTAVITDYPDLPIVQEMIASYSKVFGKSNAITER